MKFNWFEKLSKKQKQWAWFIMLWLGGLGSVLILSYAIKLLMFAQL
tara:strand:- start:297 stop:434 length:138 start_codon:yes stop_codon:yes gene_type:complete